jgi:copper chaperone CopZ
VASASAVVNASPAAVGAAALPTVETSAADRRPGFLSPVELDLVFQQPLTDSAELQTLVEAVQQLDGIAAVRSDGVHILVRYDSTRVLPARIRGRLTELGHPPAGGTPVQNPGDAAD